MVSFARARARSLLSRLWNVSFQTIEKDKADLGNSKEQLEKHKQQNTCFFEASKNGGLWLS
tara:strand:- start:149 stop:331 length:183 start_codon:yes stop_codon:yes gene_type:complete